MLQKHFLACSLWLGTMISPVFANSCLENIQPRMFCNTENTLCELNLAHCSIEDQDIPQLLSFLNEHKNIAKLDLFANNLSDDGVELISTYTDMEFLDLGHNANISNRTAETLAKKSSLKFLFLADNHIHDLLIESFCFKIISI